MASVVSCFLRPIFSSSSKESNSDAKKPVKLRDDWRNRSKPIPPGGTYPAKDHCSRCGLCDTYYISHVKEACAFLGDGMSKIEVSHSFLYLFMFLRRCFVVVVHVI
ncbi:hypothetical protein HRI_000713500 [Hibiscus trionum]|uniref:Coenzyme F420 hydrogenase/dehydrogenase beta subunit N-terminal domain-containing protein n=1 Tax=Hibiscus trionum TaxID=183268 RepID=A0A9W7LMT9_HIBTR|nr:hypothetical protein HRI_000713500 [Hibiscus trionum]